MTDRHPVRLPENPNLDWLRKEAKRKLARLRERDADAQLADAQFALAKDCGFTSWRALKTHIDSTSDQTRAAVVHLAIDTDEVYGAAFSPSLARVLTGSEGNPIQLWDARTGRHVRDFGSVADRVYALAWSADRRQFLSGGFDATMRRWDVRTGKCLRVYAQGAYVRGISPSADWRHALTACGDGTVRQWALESSDGRSILSPSFDRTIRAWNLETGECLRVLDGHRAGVKQVVYTGDESAAVSCDWSGEIRRWHLST